MKSEIKNQLKIASKSAFYVSSRIIGYCSFGWTLNLIAFSYFIFKIMPEVLGAGSRTGVGAMIGFLSIFLTPKGLLILAVFGIGFPIAYFIFGKKQGIAKALNYVINKDKVFVFEHLLTKFSEKTDPEMLANTSESFTKLIQSGLASYSEKADNMPKHMKFITNFLMKKTGVEKIITVTNELKTDSNERDDIIGSASQLLSEKIQLSAFKPSKLILPGLIIANVIVIILVEILLF